MARRPVFIPRKVGAAPVEVLEQEFRWYPGMATSQRRKSIDSLHEAYRAEYPETGILEISSFSRQALGASLSAFNIMLELGGVKAPVECFFQGSKVFGNGGPYHDLYYREPMEAKADKRLRESGELSGFLLFEQIWPLWPVTAFYDWIYINALRQNGDLAQQLLDFGAFTDIAFNPQKSLNCQARSAALFVSLKERGLLDVALESRESFLETVRDVPGDVAGETRKLPF